MRNFRESKKSDILRKKQKDEAYEKILNAVKKPKKIKRLEVDKLLDMFPSGLLNLILRNPNTVKFKSHNFHNQWIEFLRHCFCKYNMPMFMLYNFPYKLKNVVDGRIHYGGMKNVITPYNQDNITHFHRDDINNEVLYQEMFHIIASGKSFRKHVSGILTAKESHIFLTLNNTESITINMWLSIFLAAGFEERFSRVIIGRLSRRLDVIFNRDTIDEIVLFIKKHMMDVDKNTLYDIIDFLNNTMPGTQFSLKGRTLQSVMRLSNEWHQLQYSIKNKGKLTWDRLEETDRIIKIGNLEYRFIELHKSHDLFNEGSSQRHCVGSYVRSCYERKCSIFSMRVYENNVHKSRVTIEISIPSMQIVQARGRHNRLPSNLESRAIRFWAKDKYQFGAI